jgi:predicted alpha/beta superfamily hydrolase
MPPASPAAAALLLTAPHAGCRRVARTRQPHHSPTPYTYRVLYISDVSNWFAVAASCLLTKLTALEHCTTVY